LTTTGAMSCAQVCLARLELPGLAGPHEDHADGHGAHDERHGHERDEALCAGLGDVLVVRVLLRPLEHQRFALRGRQAHEPFADGNLHLAHRFPIQADRGAESEPGEVGLDQKDRAGVRIETLGHELDDVAERLVQVVRARDYRRHIGEKCDAIGNRTPSWILEFERRAAPPEPRRNASTTALDPRNRTRVG
jgi:hypothetical protein